MDVPSCGPTHGDPRKLIPAHVAAFVMHEFLQLSKSSFDSTPSQKALGSE